MRSNFNRKFIRRILRDRLMEYKCVLDDLRMQKITVSQEINNRVNQLIFEYIKETGK